MLRRHCAALIKWPKGIVHKQVGGQIDVDGPGRHAMRRNNKKKFIEKSIGNDALWT